MTIPEQGRRDKISTQGTLKLLKNWNNTKVDIPKNRCIHQLFEEQASRTPDKTAVTFGDQNLTYSQLNSKANQLANYLVSLGVKPDTLVGICIERSLEMIIGILAILKAGGAYVPLDPEYPKDRLSLMIENANVSVLLSLHKMQSILPESSARTIFLDQDWDTIKRCSSESPSSPVSPNNLIYVIYTSGSTGTPKGTLVYHRGFVNLLHWYVSEFEFGSGTQTLLMTSTSFDLTQKNIYAPLICGGNLTLLESQFFDAAILQDTIHHHNITTINCTPSAFQNLVYNTDETVFSKLASLKQIFLGGEPIIVSRFNDWRNNPHCQAQIINSYGPTECTDVCAFYPLHDYERYAENSVPIGRPICNTELYILDPELNLLPIGDEGELCIGGAGVGGGYLKRPDLTQEVFLPDPFSGKKSALIYKTGDQARFLPDGNIEYLGRIDQQVKIRGFRIELGEIEATLDRHPDVKETVVLGREDKTGEKRLIAYIVHGKEASPPTDSLRKFLQNELPDYMLPTAWVFMDKIPLTPNGKIDRKALPDPEKKRPQISQQYMPPQNALELFLAEIWCTILSIDKVGIEDPFFELGGTSIQAIQFVSKIRQTLGITVQIVHFFDTPTIKMFGQYLRINFQDSISDKFPQSGAAATLTLDTDTASTQNAALIVNVNNREISQPTHPEHAGDAIAIIGMAGRFPGAANIEEFWENLYEGTDASYKIKKDDLLAEGFDPELLSKPGYVDICYPLAEHDSFDASFFGYTPREAEILDPQHRLFLELAWSVMEDAGYDLKKCNAKVGIFGGVARNGYLVHNIASHDDLRNASWNYQSLLGNEKDFPVTRAAFKLNLTGPAVNVQTACSSSGVALHMACQSLLHGDCDMTIAGGCRVMVPHRVGYEYVDGSTLSKEGKIRAFDQDASGMVRGSGGGCILLKRLKNALEEGDHIYAVVRGTAVNNDGADKIGFTAPSIQGQAEVITKTIAMAGIEAESIQYVETHGTGTYIGDPIEIAALTKAYRNFTDKNQFCAIGSVKTNIGHLDAGSFVAGLIKTILAMNHQKIPASLNFSKPNPQINFSDTPFFVNSTLRTWEKKDFPRRAGISSFGLGGTNAHAIIEEAPTTRKSSASRPWQLITFSAKTKTALDNSIASMGKFISDHDNINLADAAYTLRVGRKDFNQRGFIVCKDQKNAAEIFNEQPSRMMILGEIPTEPPFLVFMFPGQGSQHINMGIDLYKYEPVFKSYVDYCADKLTPTLQTDIRQIIFPRESDEKLTAEQLTDTRITQPALFIIEYALAMLWLSWGIKPSGMIGHSIGDFTAACISGVFTLDEALSIVALRATLMSNLPKGSMLAVLHEENRVRKMLKGDLSLAVVNAPSRCVVSGETDHIDSFHEKITKKGMISAKVQTSHAFHSKMMEPAVAPFHELLDDIQLKPPQIPFISSSTGTWITDQQATSPRFWANQLLLPVLFSTGIKEILNEKYCVFLEVGPSNTLSLLAKQNIGRKNGHRVISSWDHKKNVHSSMECTLNALGRLWQNNVSIDWPAFYKRELRNRISLPTYPFDRKRYWIDPFNALEKPVPSTNPNKPSFPSLDQKMSPIQKTNTETRKPRILNELRQVIEELSGLTLNESDDSISFLSLGLDSLFLTQLLGRLKKNFDISLKFRQLLEDYTDIGQLGDYLDQELPKETFQDTSSPHTDQEPFHTDTNIHQEISAISPILPGQEAGFSQNETLENVIRTQLQVMKTQLDILQNIEQPGNKITLQANIPQRSSQISQNDEKSSPDSLEKTAPADEPENPPKSFGAATRIQKSTPAELTGSQKKYFDEFCGKYIAKTGKSKNYTEKYRTCLADPRVVSGFSPFFKEIVYPIVINRSSGSRVWDIDGNEYIDMINGFGSNFLGHSPEFLTKAIQEQLHRGIEIGPQHPLAGEVAQLTCEFTRMDRAVFCNTGSEAVLGAMRIARTVTGCDKIVVFTDDYHGMFDEVIVRGTKTFRSIPASSGIPFASVENILVLEYGSTDSLQIIKQEAGEIAAVLVEPVQSRNLNLQPKQFLHTLREITAEKGIALIFDEVITGFRSHMGGAQSYFNISADIATYGKILGGGMPIGVISGKSKYMDAFDGGQWQFGDTSVPETGVTYFAGTFVRHPLALAAAKAMLEHLQKCGPTLQESLNLKTTEFVTNLRNITSQLKAPIEILHFSSIFQFAYTEDVPYGNLIYPLLRSKGIHIFEGRIWFFTTAHDDTDFKTIEKAFKESIQELQEAGFIPTLTGTSSHTTIPDNPPVPGARLGKCPDGNPAWYIPDPDRPGKYMKLR